MKFSRVTLGLVLPLLLGTAAFGAPRLQEEKKPENNRPAPAAHPQEHPGQEGHSQPRQQEQPRAQEPKPQPKPQSKPESKPQEQPRQQPSQEHRPEPQAHPSGQSRQQEQPRTQEQPKTEGRQQGQPRPNESHAPSNSNAGRQEQTRPSQPSQNPSQNRGREGGRETAAGRPQHNAGSQRSAQERARSYAAATRVPQAQERTIFQQRRASNWGADHRDWRSRGGYAGFRIPVARFGLYFGRAHYFHLWGLPMVYVGGYPEFQYQGYWFELLDLVPPDWAPDWYQADEVYIDWDSQYGGYYLYDASHPDERLAVDIAG